MRERLAQWLRGELELTAGLTDAPKRRSQPPVEEGREPAPIRELERSELNTFRRLYPVAAAFLGVAIVAVLLVTVFSLPRFGGEQTPANNEVAERYIASGVEETGAINYVAGMILDYRAFDTFGESSVLFLAITSVMILLMRDKNNTDRDEDLRTARELIVENKHEDVILQRVASLVIPCILLYGIYVILNGHLSPGGGFSGGAIAGAGLILYASSFGMIRVHRFFNQKTFTAITTSCLLVYACSKGYSFFTGANHLPTGIPLGTPGAILSSGLILPLDICVGLIVTCTMYGFYAMFTKGEI